MRRKIANEKSEIELVSRPLVFHCCHGNPENNINNKEIIKLEFPRVNFEF